MKITDPSSQDGSSSNRFPPRGALSFPTNDWKSLSTDPATLLKQVHQRDGGPNRPRSGSRTSATSCARATSRRSSARPSTGGGADPGRQAARAQTDPTGQTGLGVAYYADGQPAHELIVDQQTGRLVAEEYFDKTGKLTEWTLYGSEVVDSVPNYPLDQPGPPARRVGDRQ